jgi:hypothetical protein
VFVAAGVAVGGSACAVDAVGATAPPEAPPEPVVGVAVAPGAAGSDAGVFSGVAGLVVAIAAVGVSGNAHRNPSVGFAVGAVFSVGAGVLGGSGVAVAAGRHSLTGVLVRFSHWGTPPWSARAAGCAAHEPAMSVAAAAAANPPVRIARFFCDVRGVVRMPGGLPIGLSAWVVARPLVRTNRFI